MPGVQHYQARWRVLSRLVNKVLVDCVEPPCKEFGSLHGITELGIAVLVGLACPTFLHSLARGLEEHSTE